MSDLLFYLVAGILWFIMWRPGMVMWIRQRKEARAFRRELEDWESNSGQKR